MSNNSDQRGRTFEENPELAREAGRKGGSQNTDAQEEARRENIEKARQARENE